MIFIGIIHNCFLCIIFPAAEISCFGSYTKNQEFIHEKYNKKDSLKDKKTIK